MGIKWDVIEAMTGKAFLARRKSIGLTTRKMAEMAGVSQSTISRYEGGRDIKMITFVKIWKAIESEESKDE